MYSLPLVAVVWAVVGITAGWIAASHKDYRDPAAVSPLMVITEVHAARQLPVDAFADRVVAHAKVAVGNTVSVRAVAPYAGVGGSVVIRTRIRRHAVTGPAFYNTPAVPTRILEASYA